ncbi:MAG: AvaI/BsoBI family type II restriction endonuclease [FCB group bacterium]|jgi:type II restriction enzyme
MNYKEHLKNYNDLITPYEETRAGFVSLALEKNRQATPFVEEAKTLKVLASKAKSPLKLLEIEDIRIPLITASGLSDKAISHLTEENINTALLELIKNYLEPAGNKFVEELVYRFLLTKGDTLGGMMRNLGGVIGERKLIRCLISTLKVMGHRYYWFDGINWIEQSDNDSDIELRLKGISWRISKHRTLLLNLKVPIVNKNVDLCLFNCDYSELNRLETSFHREPSKYIALGELKGGIDPAGADEHWKTANSALDRIRKAFATISLKPMTFFVGAVIERSMAEEIYNQLLKGTLSNAANLTNTNQIVSICKWLIKL